MYCVGRFAPSQAQIQNAPEEAFQLLGCKGTAKFKSGQKGDSPKVSNTLIYSVLNKITHKNRGDKQGTNLKKVE